MDVYVKGALDLTATTYVNNQISEILSKRLASGKVGVTANYTLYDYSAVMFPSGNSIKLAFNHNQIAKIISIGYQDTETLAYIQELNSIEPIIRMIYKKKKNEVTQDV